MLHGASASLRFTTVCQQSYRWLPRLLEVFEATHPDVDVSIVADAGDVSPRKVTLVPMNGTVAVDMAGANLGVTLLPRWTIDSVGDDQRVGRGGLWLSWGMATRGEEPEAALRIFLAALRASHPRAKPKRR